MKATVIYGSTVQINDKGTVLAMLWAKMAVTIGKKLWHNRMGFLLEVICGL